MMDPVQTIQSDKLATFRLELLTLLGTSDNGVESERNLGSIIALDARAGQVRAEVLRRALRVLHQERLIMRWLPWGRWKITRAGQRVLRYIQAGNTAMVTGNWETS